MKNSTNKKVLIDLKKYLSRKQIKTLIKVIDRLDKNIESLMIVTLAIVMITVVPQLLVKIIPWQFAAAVLFIIFTFVLSLIPM